MRLVQLEHKTKGRKVALVEEPQLRPLKKFTSIYELASVAIENGGSLTSLVHTNLSDVNLDYDVIYDGKSDWKLWMKSKI